MQLPIGQHTVLETERAGSSNRDVGHGVCFAKPERGTMQGTIVIPVAPAARGKRVRNAFVYEAT